MTDNTKISVHTLAHSKGVPTAATEAMMLMQDRIEVQAAEIERLRELLDAWTELAREHLDTELAGRTFAALRGHKS